MLRGFADHLLAQGIRSAVFDVDNTLTRSNVVEFYLYIKARRLPNRWLYRAWLCWFAAARIPLFLLLDFFNRDWFQRAFYRCYRSIPPDELDQHAAAYFEEKLKGKFIRDVHDFLLYLKSNGVRIELLSTSIDPLIARYGEYFGVPFHSLKARPLGSGKPGTEIVLADLKDFKKNRMRAFEPASTLAVADSKHDLDALGCAAHALVVSSKRPKWMDGLPNARWHARR